MMVALTYWYATIALLRDSLSHAGGKNQASPYKDSSCAGLTGLGFSLAVLSIAETTLRKISKEHALNTLGPRSSQPSQGVKSICDVY